MNNYYKFLLKSFKKNKLITFYLIIRLFIFKKLSFLEKKYYKKFLELNSNNLNYKDEGKYSQDWFTYNIKYISRVIYKFKLIDKKLSILEIGSYEGLSTVFFLKVLKNSSIICVDPFFDFEENKDKNFNIVYENFKFNTRDFQDRMKLYKLTSDECFAKNLSQKFDLIFIDGSHHCDSVFKDANNSFKALNKGGFIIFDDFFWDYYEEVNLNPIGAIKKFIFENFFSIKIVSLGYQIIIQKV